MEMLTILFSIYAIILGAIFGSFVTAIAWRLGRHHEINEDKDKYSISKGRSMCAICEHPLRWWNLIPILSFIIQRGKCAYCGKKISLYYFFSEASSAVFFLVVYLNFMNGVFDIYFSIFLLIIFIALNISSLMDSWYGEISDRVLLPSITFAFLFITAYGAFFEDISYILNHYAVFITVFVIFSALIIFSNGMGGGDLRVMSLISLVLPFPYILISFTVSFSLALIGGTVQAIRSRNNTIARFPVRLIPYLLLGFIVVITFYSEIPKWIGII